MEREQGWRIIDEHRGRVADLLAGLTPEEWSRPSLCDGWTVREVAAHLTMAPLISRSEAVRAAVRARGNFNRMIHDTAVDRAAVRTNEQIVADLRGIAGSRRLAPGTFWRDPLIDALVHGEDIARAVGRAIELPVDAAVEAAEWAWRRGFPFRPRRHLAGVRLVADDVDWQRGAGAELRGPIADLLLLSTGRRRALSAVHGPGVEALALSR